MMYIISYGNYDEYVPYYLESDYVLTQQQFNQEAQALLPEAEKLALSVNPDNYVGWREIAKALYAVLIDTGRYRAPPGLPEVELWGRNIIKHVNDTKHRDFQLSQKVIDHNLKIEEATQFENYKNY